MTVYAGQMLTADIINAVLAQTQQLFVVKPSDESVTSSTAFQNDDHLLLPVEASTRYLMEALIIYDAATGGDLKPGWYGPAGATMDWHCDHLDSGVTNTWGIIIKSASPISDTNHGAGGAGSGTNVSFTARGNLLVSGTAGNFGFRWGQLSSSGTATRVRAGSLLRLTRLA